MRVGYSLLAITFLLAAVGALFYLDDLIGWAQFCWALASGTAGGGIAIVVEHRFEREKKYDANHWKNQPP